MCGPCVSMQLRGLCALVIAVFAPLHGAFVSFSVSCAEILHRQSLGFSPDSCRGWLWWGAFQMQNRTFTRVYLPDSALGKHSPPVLSADPASGGALGWMVWPALVWEPVLPRELSSPGSSPEAPGLVPLTVPALQATHVTAPGWAWPGAREGWGAAVNLSPRGIGSRQRLRLPSRILLHSPLKSLHSPGRSTHFQVKCECFAT